MPTISYDKAVDFYDATRSFSKGGAESIRDAIVKYTSADITTRFLELGIGTGRIALPFIQSGFNYTGVDISTAMMDKLDQKLAKDVAFASYQYRLEQADVRKLPFQDSSFDLALTVHVLHLLDDWQAAVQEAKRVLVKPVGNFIISGNEQGSGRNRATPLGQSQKKWEEIHTELAKSHTYSRRIGWISDEKIIAYLEELGASVRVETLIEYHSPELSIREAAERLKARNYSADWDTPEDIHQEAARLLDKWLAEEHPEPDRKVSPLGEFRAIIATW